jgi:hypothetical protein
MSFAEKFIACMSEAGIRLDNTTTIDDPAYFGEAVNYVKTWFDGLEQNTREAFDAAGSTGEPVAIYFSDEQIAPGLPELMIDFDQNSGWPISTLLDWCLHCIEAASADDE